MSSRSPRRRKRTKVTPHQVAWLLWLTVALWPLAAFLAGYRAHWAMIVTTSVTSALLVWLLPNYIKPKRRTAAKLPKSFVPMAERLAKQPTVDRSTTRQVKTSEKLSTPRTRERAKLAAAAELAELQGFAEDMKAVWDAIDLAAATEADVVTQRELEQGTAEWWLADPDHKEAS